MPQSTPPQALALLGPTAAGKTALALALAEKLPLEIVSLDSANKKLRKTYKSFGKFVY